MTSSVSALALLSGDFDSAILVGLLRASTSHRVLTVNYSTMTLGSYWQDIASQKIAQEYNVPHLQVSLYDITKTLPKVGTVHDIPAKNLTLVTLLTNLAINYGHSELWLPFHDGPEYRQDCKPGFVRHLRETINLTTDGKIRLVTPFLYNNKSELLKFGLGLVPPVPWSSTRSCLHGSENHCGTCDRCVARKEAFASNNFADPTTYVN